MSHCRCNESRAGTHFGMSNNANDAHDVLSDALSSGNISLFGVSGMTSDKTYHLSGNGQKDLSYAQRVFALADKKNPKCEPKGWPVGPSRTTCVTEAPKGKGCIVQAVSELQHQDKCQVTIAARITDKEGRSTTEDGEGSSSWQDYRPRRPPVNDARSLSQFGNISSEDSSDKWRRQNKDFNNSPNVKINGSRYEPHGTPDDGNVSRMKTATDGEEYESAPSSSLPAALPLNFCPASSSGNSISPVVKSRGMSDMDAEQFASTSVNRLQDLKSIERTLEMVEEISSQDFSGLSKTSTVKLSPSYQTPKKTTSPASDSTNSRKSSKRQPTENRVSDISSSKSGPVGKGSLPSNGSSSQSKPFAKYIGLSGLKVTFYSSKLSQGQNYMAALRMGTTKTVVSISLGDHISHSSCPRSNDKQEDAHQLLGKSLFEIGPTGRMEPIHITIFGTESGLPDDIASSGTLGVESTVETFKTAGVKIPILFVRRHVLLKGACWMSQITNVGTAHELSLDISLFSTLDEAAQYGFRLPIQDDSTETRNLSHLQNYSSDSKNEQTNDLSTEQKSSNAKSSKRSDCPTLLNECKSPPELSFNKTTAVESELPSRIKSRDLPANDEGHVEATGSVAADTYLMSDLPSLSMKISPESPPAKAAYNDAQHSAHPPPMVGSGVSSAARPFQASATAISSSCQGPLATWVQCPKPEKSSTMMADMICSKFTHIVLRLESLTFNLEFHSQHHSFKEAICTVKYQKALGASEVSSLECSDFHARFSFLSKFTLPLQNSANCHRNAILIKVRSDAGSKQAVAGAVLDLSVLADLWLSGSGGRNDDTPSPIHSHYDLVNPHRAKVGRVHFSFLFQNSLPSPADTTSANHSCEPNPPEQPQPTASINNLSAAKKEERRDTYGSSSIHQPAISHSVGAGVSEMPLGPLPARQRSQPVDLPNAVSTSSSSEVCLSNAKPCRAQSVSRRGRLTKSVGDHQHVCICTAGRSSILVGSGPMTKYPCEVNKEPEKKTSSLRKFSRRVTSKFRSQSRHKIKPDIKIHINVLARHRDKIAKQHEALLEGRLARKGSQMKIEEKLSGPISSSGNKRNISPVFTENSDRNERYCDAISVDLEAASSRIAEEDPFFESESASRVGAASQQMLSRAISNGSIPQIPARQNSSAKVKKSDTTSDVVNAMALGPVKFDGSVVSFQAISPTMADMDKKIVIKVNAPQSLGFRSFTSPAVSLNKNLREVYDRDICEFNWDKELFLFEFVVEHINSIMNKSIEFFVLEMKTGREIGTAALKIRSIIFDDPDDPFDSQPGAGYCGVLPVRDSKKAIVGALPVVVSMNSHRL